MRLSCHKLDWGYFPSRPREPYRRFWTGKGAMFRSWGAMNRFGLPYFYHRSLSRDNIDPAKRRCVHPTPNAPLDLIPIDTHKRILPRPFTHKIFVESTGVLGRNGCLGHALRLSPPAKRQSEGVIQYAKICEKNATKTIGISLKSPWNKDSEYLKQSSQKNFGRTCQHDETRA